MLFRSGDSVVVNKGVKDPGMGDNLSGWQGRITAINKHEEYDDQTIEIAWDSITLKNMAESIIVHCELEGLDWSVIGLSEHDLTLVKARDTKHDTDQEKGKLAEQYGWISMGNDEEQGRRIQAVVNSADKKPSHRNHELAVMEAWDKQLRKLLKLPFVAEVIEFQERGPFRSGDEITVVSFLEVDDHYGILVTVEHRRKKFHFPLGDLEVSDVESPNHDFLEDYRIWFANR